MCSSSTGVSTDKVSPSDFFFFFTAQRLHIFPCFIILSSDDRAARNRAPVYSTLTGQRGPSLATLGAMREINHETITEMTRERRGGAEWTGRCDKGEVWTALCQSQRCLGVINLTQITFFNWVHDLWTEVWTDSSKRLTDTWDTHQRGSMTL